MRKNYPNFCVPFLFTKINKFKHRTPSGKPRRTMPSRLTQSRLAWVVCKHPKKLQNKQKRKCQKFNCQKNKGKSTEFLESWILSSSPVQKPKKFPRITTLTSNPFLSFLILLNKFIFFSSTIEKKNNLKTVKIKKGINFREMEGSRASGERNTVRWFVLSNSFNQFHFPHKQQSQSQSFFLILLLHQLFVILRINIQFYYYYFLIILMLKKECYKFCCFNSSKSLLLFIIVIPQKILPNSTSKAISSHIVRQLSLINF